MSAKLGAFNPRSYKRSDWFIFRCIPDLRTFNPRSYKRSDLTVADVPEHPNLSIHAPTRGATLSPVLSWRSHQSFNPRSYKRSDIGMQIYILQYDKLSIHAPTRGATPTISPFLNNWILSIHAPTRGATKFSYLFILGLFFQSTLLQEERHQYQSSLHNAYTFNPRSYKRSDHLPEMSNRSCYSFNPRSYKRSDIIYPPFKTPFILSIHAPTRGATICNAEYTNNGAAFNPRSYKRSDNSRNRTHADRLSFNPRSYKRSDPYHFAFSQ